MTSCLHIKAIKMALLLSVMLIATLAFVHNGFAAPSVAGCSVFSADNVWNTPVDTLPLDPNSQAYVTTIGENKGLHADFGSGLWDGGPIGIPYTIATGLQPLVNVSFQYASESDPGPYPIPPDALIEGGPQSDGDRHVLVIDSDNCVLYELFAAYPQTDGSWHAGSGAIFNLRSNALRPSTWTSADAAGLPILPGLVRYDEVAAGEIKHALRFTAPQTRDAFIWPARHEASSLTGQQYPPMGQRFRLKASFDVSDFSEAARVILRALKKYGMILADNGSSWYISGAPDPGWDNDVLHELGSVTGSAFEAVDESSLMISHDSGQVAVHPAEFQLTTTVNASQAGAAVPDCSAGCWYDSGALASLVAVPAAGHVFDGWSGDCAGRNPSVSVAMTAPKGCTADFTACADLPVRIMAEGFLTVQGAYRAAGENDVIRILAADLQEELLLDRSISVILKGGHTCGYGSNPSMSLIRGPVVITQGTVTVENLLIISAAAAPSPPGTPPVP